MHVLKGIDLNIKKGGWWPSWSHPDQENLHCNILGMLDLADEGEYH